MRLAAVRPFQCTRDAGQEAVAPPREQNDPEVLRMALRLLEKTRLMHTDPRGEGFRWYIAIPWHTIAVAAGQCCVCTDEVLVRHAWPIVETCYRLLEAFNMRHGIDPGQGPMAKLMRQTREKLSALLQSSQPSSRSDSTFSLSNPALPSPAALFAYPWAHTQLPPPTNGHNAPQAAMASASTQLPVQPTWDPLMLSTTEMQMPDALPLQDIPESSSAMWD